MKSRAIFQYLGVQEDAFIVYPLSVLNTLLFFMGVQCHTFYTGTRVELKIRETWHFISYIYLGGG